MNGTSAPTLRRSAAALLAFAGCLALSHGSWTAVRAMSTEWGTNSEAGSMQNVPPAPSDCRPTTAHLVESDRIPAGETVGLTLTVSAGCPDRTPAVHIAVVIDATVDREGLDDVKRGAEAWLRRVVKNTHPHSRASVIQFTDSARRVCPFTNDIEVAVNCLNRLRPGSGPSRTDAGIKRAVDELRKERASVETSGEIREVFTLYANAKDEACSAIEREASSAARNGVRFMVRCGSAYSGDCASRCLSDIRARSEPVPFEYTSPIPVPPLRLQTLLVTDTFAANMPYVDGSARPAPSSVAADGSMLSWSAAFVLAGTFTLRLRPLDVGTWPVSPGPVHGTFVDQEGGVGTLAFDIPSIEVLPPLERPTDLPTSTSEPTKEPTTVPTIAPSPTDEPVEPSATPRAPIMIFLPFAVR